MRWEIGGIAFIVAVVSIAAAQKPANQLKLVSPNGKFSILMEAKDDGASIYIWQGSNRGVSIYTNDRGPAVTLYGDTKVITHPGIALATDGKGGILQVADKAGVTRFVTVGEKGIEVEGLKK